ncbi:MAG: hypothetical protein KGL10_06770 [Alphaproteobacteria bacterium]|nr:hypothetical protein [Alphaproteobacteria bacterium]
MPGNKAPDSGEDVLVLVPESLRGFIHALGAAQVLRKRHKDTRITALAAPRFLAPARQSGCFDALVSGWRGLRARRFSCVYDLRGGADEKARRRFLRLLLRGRPLWPSPDISCPPDISWMTAETGLFGLERPYVLLLTGASRHPEKNWPPHRTAALALKLSREGFQPVLLGTDADADTAEKVLRVCPRARDLCGLTSLCDLAALARGAAAALGTDTGATCLAALTGCPTQVIRQEDSVGAVYRAFAPREGGNHAA